MDLRVGGDHHRPRLNRGTRLSLPLKGTTHPLSNSSSSRMGVRVDTQTLTLTHPSSSSSNTTTPLLPLRSSSSSTSRTNSTSNRSRLTAANVLRPSNVRRAGTSPLPLRTTRPLLLRSSAGASRVKPAAPAAPAAETAVAVRNGAATPSPLRARDGTSPSRLRRRSTAWKTRSCTGCEWAGAAERRGCGVVTRAPEHSRTHDMITARYHARHTARRR